MATQVLENWELLKAHHLRSMPLDQKRALFLRACGLRDEEAAALEGVSTSTFRRRLYGATCLIGMCLPEDGPVTAELRARG
jgi:DNA-directed RNA polymerase specialized sigma24 family protein